MEKQEAKKLSLEIWGYLKDHPEINKKENLPDDLYAKIASLESNCPLCEIYNNDHYGCEGCPLLTEFRCHEHLKWMLSKTNEDRKKYATEIYNKVKTWNIENE